VLIVDDNAVNRQILLRHTAFVGHARHGHRIAGDGAALDHDGERFDVALLDLQMAGMDGLALAEAIEPPRKAPSCRSSC